jgi:hypothetical protein
MEQADEGRLRVGLEAPTPRAGFRKVESIKGIPSDRVF